MATYLTCAHPECANFFRRNTSRSYCSDECRMDNRRCYLCRGLIGPIGGHIKRRICRECDAERARAYRLDPSVKAHAVAATRRSKFGMTTDEYAAKLQEQDGVCAICHQQETVTRRGEYRTLAVDHCHTTGRIRGLLCSRCNTALGLFKDDPTRLGAAMDYLTKYGTKA